MAVLRESPWYQEGLQQGLQQGRQEGVQKGLVEAVLYLLRTRFDLSDHAVESLVMQLQKVSEDKALRQLLVEAASMESIDEFQVSLERAAGIVRPTG
jgi:predicted transposase YdaD